MESHHHLKCSLNIYHYTYWAVGRWYIIKVSSKYSRHDGWCEKLSYIAKSKDKITQQNMYPHTCNQLSLDHFKCSLRMPHWYKSMAFCHCGSWFASSNYRKIAYHKDTGTAYQKYVLLSSHVSLQIVPPYARVNFTALKEHDSSIALINPGALCDYLLV